MGRTDFFFALRHHHQIDRHFLVRATDRMQRSEKRGFRSLLIHCAPADNRFSERRLVYQARLGRRRRPLRRIELFHVVHEIKADRFRGTGIERRKHAWLSIGVDHCRLLKARVARELGHVIRAFGISAVLRRNRHLTDPILQSLHRLIMAFRDLRFDLGMIIFRCAALVSCQRDRC